MLLPSFGDPRWSRAYPQSYISACKRPGLAEWRWKWKGSQKCDLQPSRGTSTERETRQGHRARHPAGRRWPVPGGRWRAWRARVHRRNSLTSIRGVFSDIQHRPAGLTIPRDTSRDKMWRSSSGPAFIAMCDVEFSCESNPASPPLSHRTGHAPATRRGARLRRPWHRLGRRRSRVHAGASEAHAAADMEGNRGCWRHGGDPGFRHAKLRRVPCGPVVVTVA